MNINYISGIPGVGKTQWAIQETASRVRGRKGVTIYAAPTIELLTQFEKDLKKELKEDDIDLGNIVLITSRRTGSQSVVPVSEIVERYLHGNLSTKLYRSLNTINRSTVLLITHKTLYRLDVSEVRKTILKNTHVIFDEAKKSIFGRSLSLGQRRVAAYMDSLTNKKVFKGYFKVTLKDKNIDLQQVGSQLMKLGMPFRGLANVIDIFGFMQTGNVDVFINQAAFKNRTTLHYMTLPLKVFKPYAQTTLMAAHLEKSQMFNMLWSQPEVNLNNITTTMPWIHGREKAIHKRYEKVVIIPLTLQKDTPISLYKLEHYLAPRGRLNDMQATLQASEVKSTHIARAKEYIETGAKLDRVLDDHPKVHIAYKQLNARINKVQMNPISWLLSQSKRVADHVDSRNKQTTKPLLFVNNKFTHYVQKYPDLDRVSTYCYGINSYSKSNIAIYLAAINPNSEHIAFLKAFLGDRYSYIDDYTIDTCLQCISRTSIRDTSSQETVYLIVPDLIMAEMIQKALVMKPTIDTRYAKKLGDMRLFSNTVLSSSALQQDLERPKVPSSSIMYKDRNRLYVARSRQRSRKSKVPVDEKLEINISKQLSFLATCLRRRFTDEEYLAAKKEQGFNY